MRRSSVLRAAASVAAVTAAAACAGGNESGTLMQPDFSYTDYPIPTATVCKVGSDATFDVSINGAAPTQHTLTDGECKIVFTWTPGPYTVTVTEAVPTGFILDSIVRDSFEVRTGISVHEAPITGTTTASITVHELVGGILTFYNSPEPPPPPETGVCEGKVTQLTLEYQGSASPAHVQVYMRGKKNQLGSLIFDGTVATGGQFTFNGADRHGTMGPEIDVYVDGVKNTSIHTSCSQPIGPGLVRGDFEVIEGYSRGGGLLPPLTP